MLIKVLVENTTLTNDFKSEHGFSLYIETKNKRILFDVGASDLFLENAKKLDVDISKVDYLIISHGHYDHGGGLKTFLRENKKAKVFIHHLAFEKYYARRLNNKLEFIGLDESLKENKQIIFTSNIFNINDEIELFSNVLKKDAPLKSNSGLFKENKGEKIIDKFEHEQNLVIKDEDKTLLITGCAHNGIVNILEHYYQMKGKMPNYVIGGFHLFSRSGGMEDFNRIEKIAKYLNKTKAKFYTCHCTGEEPYKILKNIMNDNIDYLSTGSVNILK